MNKKAAQIAAHRDDIDFRTVEERQKDAPGIFIEWHKQLIKGMREFGYSDYLQGQLNMLSAVLWHTIPPAEFKALKLGKEYIDQKSLTPEQRRLFISMMAFNGSKNCIKDNYSTVIASYSARMTEIGKPDMVGLVDKEFDLATKIAKNIAAEELA